MIAEGCFHKTFDLRFCNDHFGFEWHETFIDILVNNEGIPDRILLSSRNINDFRKAQIIETAVRSEYDYVIYIEASKKAMSCIPPARRAIVPLLSPAMTMME